MSGWFFCPQASTIKFSFSPDGFLPSSKGKAERVEGGAAAAHDGKPAPLPAAPKKEEEIMI